MKRAILILLLLTAHAMAAGPASHEALKYGAPDTGHLIDYGSYVMSYDGRLRSARWVAEKLTPKSVEIDCDRQNDFRPDRRIPGEFRAELSDYRNSGYDRGHLAPSGNHVRSRSDNSRTFFLSNMSPQVGVGFNRDYWKELEHYIKEFATSERVKEMYLFTGPLFMPEDAPPQGLAAGTMADVAKEEPDPGMEAGELTVTYKMIGGNHIPVPTHYFKALLVVPAAGKRSEKLFTVVLPNRAIEDKTPLDEFARSVDYVEHWAGFDLWSKLPPAEQEEKEGTAWLPAEADLPPVKP